MTPELTATSEVVIEFETFCGRCGAGICGNVTVEENHRYPRIIVDPCEKCLSAAHNEGYEEGRRESA